MRTARVGAVVVGFTGVVTLLSSTASAGDPKSPGFVDEAVARGLVYESVAQTGYGRGVSFTDLDSDGDPDIIAFGAADQRVGIFENDGTGHFTERPDGQPELPSNAVVAVAADFDGDGDPDLFIGRWMLSPLLWRNDGNFTFTDVTDEWGLDTSAYGAGGPAAADIDGDGDLDLAAGNYEGPSLIYRNDGGVFVEVGAEMGVHLEDMPFYQSTFVDYDHDGDLDLYHAADRGVLCETPLQYRSHLLRNDGGWFTNVTAESNTEGCINAMCITVGDLDRDGLNDLYSTNTPAGNAFFLNRGDGSFDRAEVEAGITVNKSGWGSIFLDHNNDGWLDLFVANNPAANAFFVGGPKWPLVDTGLEMGLHTPKTIWTNATADVDGDGRLDILGGGLWGANLILKMNKVETDHAYARFAVSGVGRHRDAIGASVIISAGGVTQTRPITAGDSFRAQSELIAHFGVRHATQVDEIQVGWPDGTSRTLGPARVDRTYRIPHPATLGDVNIDLVVDLDDFLAAAGSWTGDAPGTLEPGGERMDFDGDFDVDASDIAAFVKAAGLPADDCDGDGTLDLVQIASGAASDVNGDGVIDLCQTIPPDVNVDFIVDATDLGMIVQAWGTPVHDLDGDGTTGFSEILMVLVAWD